MIEKRWMTGAAIACALAFVGIAGSASAAPQPPSRSVADPALPSLDKAFSPTVQRTGANVTLTFTITNTATPTAHEDWSFTDTLPDRLRIASPDGVSTTCPDAVVSTDTVNEVITASGDLGPDQESCEITVDVTSNRIGEYSNGPDNVVTTGLNPPADAATVAFTDTDFGDAPESYQTSTSGHGTSPVMRIGDSRDREAVASPTADASGDDNDSPFFDDEDAFEERQTWRTDQDLTLDVPVQNTSETEDVGTLVGWIDVNRDGDFDDDGEQSSTGMVEPGATSVPLSWPATSDAVPGESFLRLRLYTEAGDTPAPTGPAVGGEIEDHLIDLQVPRIELVKDAGDVADLDGNGVDEGDTIDYTFTVTNTGNVPLTDVAVTDDMLDAAGATVDCPETTLDAGDDTVCTATYTLVQADIDAALLRNSAVATGTPPGGEPVTSPGAGVDVVLNPERSLSISAAGDVRDANTSERTDAGDTIAYVFEVTNTGNATVSGITVVGAPADPVTCDVTTLAPGAATPCTGSYALDQSEIDAGEVTSTVRAAGASPDGTTVESPDEDIQVPLEQVRSLGLDKTASPGPDAQVSAGEQVTYSFAITNTGTVTLTDVQVADEMLENAGEAVLCPSSPLAPGHSISCTAEYTVTTADTENDAELVNTATASAAGPAGASVTSDPDTASVHTLSMDPAPEPTPDTDAEPTPDTDAEPTPDTDAEPTPDTAPDTDAEPESALPATGTRVGLVLLLGAGLALTGAAVRRTARSRRA
ncbi:DUF7507 domain-containing protein [Ruania alba]|uniref:Conserved repeat domain-containing protein n=1 Tax=Ruania alba TaxID=648782 RepID=A0A1H5N418_9MICO|nr:GEVED domain-containing protein [Ruania alba]SEE96359.1 conserved repeat domain-containing protein [Ruania alba]